MDHADFRLSSGQVQVQFRLSSDKFFKISLCYDKKWEIKLCISVNIYRRLLKLGNGAHVFKITLCYDKKWEIKLCISVNIYHRLPKLGMSTHFFKISLML